MGNTLSTSNTLFATYVPVNVSTLPASWRCGEPVATSCNKRTDREEKLERAGLKSWNGDHDAS